MVVAWGYNNDGETDVPSGLTNVVAISAGSSHSLALKSDGTVVAWGDNFDGETNVPPGLTNVAAVSAGFSYSLALKSNGTVIAWGYGTYGVLNVPLDLTNVVAISAGGHHSLALKRDGTVVAWGSSYVPPGLTNVVAISAGDSHSLALKNDGTVVAWGSNNYGQTDVPVGLTNVMAISAGGDFNLVLVKNLPPPINDHCSGAIEILLNDSTYFMNTVAATSTDDPTDCGVTKGVWYQFQSFDSGTVTINTCGSDFNTVLSVYTGSCGSLVPVPGACDDGSGASCTSVSFDAIVGEPYWILAGGRNGASGYLNISAHECFPPQINQQDPVDCISQTTEPDGIHMHFRANIFGTVTSCQWQVLSGNAITTSQDQYGNFEVVVSPTNDVPVQVSLVSFTGPCGGSQPGGNSPGVPPCSFCLSHGTPSLLTGATGSGPNLSAKNTCLPLGANTRWYQIRAYDSGLITVSAEGSSNVNQIAVCAGLSIAALTNVNCATKPETHVTFNAVANTTYWYAVDPGTNSPTTLRVASGYEPSIQSFGVTNGAFKLFSTLAPPTVYKVLASTNPALPFSQWPVVFRTNWNTNIPVTDFHIDFRDTNLMNPRQRFYRLAPGP